LKSRRGNFEEWEGVFEVFEKQKKTRLSLELRLVNETDTHVLISAAAALPLEIPLLHSVSQLLATFPDF
jgi:hypothetical protein